MDCLEHSGGKYGGGERNSPNGISFHSMATARICIMNSFIWSKAPLRTPTKVVTKQYSPVPHATLHTRSRNNLSLKHSVVQTYSEVMCTFLIHDSEFVVLSTWYYSPKTK